MKKGIFWCMDFDTNHPKLIIAAVACDRNGLTNEAAAFSAKSGENFNHKAEWSKPDKRITREKPFNNYLRGRVEIKNGKAAIFLNPDLPSEPVIRQIFDAFEIAANNGLKSIRVQRDGSWHYRYICHDPLQLP